jgi:type I restriction enzyme S subunit
MNRQGIKRYEAYKDSGVEWIEATPIHWPNLRLKNVIAKLESGVSVNASGEPVEGDNIGVLKTSCVGKGTFLPNQNKSVWSTEIERVCVPVRAGRIIISRMNTPELVGASAYIPKDYPNLFLPDRLWQTVFFANVKLDSKWLSLLMGCSAFRFLLSTLATGTSPSMKNLGQEKLLSISFPFPHLLEQQAIAAYLDTQTAQIDRKIELLRQKAAQYSKLKQSLINETVTRGLDKTVPMKDSGVEWIGKVPAHWEVRRVKDLSMLQSGNTIVSEQIEEAGLYPVYGGNGLRGYFSKYTNNGDYILIGRQGALCGNINYASGKFWASEHAIVVYLNRFINMKWYGEMLRVMNLNQYSVSAAQPGLAVDRIKRLLLPVPPFSEQQAIAAYLDEKTAHIDRIIATINSQIDKLKELRLTLINDVVTGKIKVA